MGKAGISTLKGVTFPRGFKASGVSCGIKKNGLDLGILYSERKASISGVFTRNAIKAAPIKVTMERIKRGFARCIVVNSGNANACTGEKGIKDALEMCFLAEKFLNLENGDALVLSTGVIGDFLPMEKVRKGIEKAVSSLSEDGWEGFSRAIMTTDTFAKNCELEIPLGGKSFRIGGSCKGAGMIKPNMATMLAFITTDLWVEPDLLKKTLASIVNETFNKITVDGDTSTNDAVIIMANGLSEIKCDGKVLEVFSEGLYNVCEKLSYMIVKDGEGATKVVKLIVKGAPSQEEAEMVADAVSNSLLVKTALFGCDPNWGRIVAAVGYSGSRVEEEKLVVSVGEAVLFKNGRSVKEGEDLAKSIMKGEEFTIVVDLNMGIFSTFRLMTDLSHDYVTINAAYRT